MIFLGRVEEASDCTACGNCERVCTQHINIIENLKTITEELETEDNHIFIENLKKTGDELHRNRISRC